MSRPPALSIADLAAQWNCPEERIRRMARRGEIPSFKVGREYRFNQRDVDAYERRAA